MSLRLVATLLVPSALAGQTRVPPPADQIAAAVLPLPEALRTGAGVRGYDAALKKITLRESTNGMVCTGDRPGDDELDVRCYERGFLAVIDRNKELNASGAFGALTPRFEQEIKTGKLHLPAHPTAGYRMLGPIGAYDPKTRTWTSAIEKWQSVHFPYKTAAEVGLPVERESVLPYMMASGTWWAHVMIQHAPPGPDEDTRSPRLGTLAFANSGAAAAQDDFIRGVLYLHSFEYEFAAEAFRHAQEKDPGFVMAYWGQAMTHTHPIWNEQDLPAARAVLARLAPTREARAAKAPTARERAWLDAVEILYGNGSKERRDTLYARAMERLAGEHPDDEARTFLALAMMGLSQGVRDVPSYMRAGAIALEVFARQPDHPGAAHYVIHAFDDPTHATLGLPAARAYSRIAPGAAHAQHMTTHIFLALGMWDDVIAQNIAASGPDRTRWQAGHYTTWLHYGLLQAGRFDSAAALLDLLRANQGAAASAGRRAGLAWARAHQVITSERWNDPSLGWTLPVDAGSATYWAVDGFARGYAALRRGETAVAEAIATEMETIKSGAGPAAVPGLLAREIRAAITRSGGDKAAAEKMLVAVASDAAALPVDFGPPDLVKPPQELLGEWLLEDGRSSEAKRAFEAALAATPGRLLSVRGLARARRAESSSH